MFNPTQLYKIARIVRTTHEDVVNTLDWLNEKVTLDFELAVEGELARWDAADLDTDFDRLTPTQRTAGLDSDPSRIRADIRQALSDFFERPDWLRNSGTSQSGSLERG